MTADANVNMGAPVHESAAVADLVVVGDSIDAKEGLPRLLLFGWKERLHIATLTTA
jgi:hypothetical protein